MAVDTTTPRRRSVGRRRRGRGDAQVARSAPELQPPPAQARVPRLGTSLLFAAWVAVCTIFYFTAMVGGRVSTLLKEWIGG